jgi:flagellar biosynthesis/type III secretory pathway chaperone
MTPIEETQVDSLIRVASRLVAVMEQEIAILRTMRTRDIAALQEEKATLAAVYDGKVRDLARDPAVLARVSTALQQEFADVAACFHATLAENERAIRAARAVQEKMLQAIVAAVDKSRARHQGYGADAACAASGRKSDPLSLTLDRRL